MSLCVILVICMMSFMQSLAITNKENINCKFGEDCSVDCDATNSCAGLQINCPVDHSCTITCTQPKLCHQTSIDAQYSSSLTLYTNNIFMSALSIIVPPSTSGKPTTYIYSQSNINDIKISNDYIPLQLYSINGFNDIQIISHNKIDHNYQFLGAMHCTKSYSKSCDFHALAGAWSCIDKNHICNQPQYPSRRLLNTDTNTTTSSPQTTIPFTTYYTQSTIVSVITLHSLFDDFKNNLLYQIIAILIILMFCFLCCLLYSCNKTIKTTKQIRHLTLRMDELIARKYSSLSSRSPHTPMSFSPFSTISPNTNTINNNNKIAESVSFNPMATNHHRTIPPPPIATKPKHSNKMLSNNTTLTSINTIFYQPESKPSPPMQYQRRRPTYRPAHKRSNNSSVVFKFAAKKTPAQATKPPSNSSTTSSTHSVPSPPPPIMMNNNDHGQIYLHGQQQQQEKPWTPKTKNSTVLPHVRHVTGSNLSSINHFVVQIPETHAIKETQMIENPLATAMYKVNRHVRTPSNSCLSGSESGSDGDGDDDDKNDEIDIPEHNDEIYNDVRASIWTETDINVDSLLHLGVSALSLGIADSISAVDDNININDDDSVLGEMLGLTAIAKKASLASDQDAIILREDAEIV